MLMLLFQHLFSQDRPVAFTTLLDYVLLVLLAGGVEQHRCCGTCDVQEDEASAHRLTHV